MDPVASVTNQELPGRGVLYVIACAAPPAAQVGELVRLAVERSWNVAVTASPDAVPFMDLPVLERLTGYPVRTQWRKPGEPSSVPDADALVAAPATFTTRSEEHTSELE